MTQEQENHAEPETFAQFAERLGLEMEARAVAVRPETGSDWGKDSIHFMVTIHRVPAGANPERPPVIIWSGFYSVGSAWPEMWARDGCKVTRRERDRDGRTRPPHDFQARAAYARLDHKTRMYGRGVSLHDAELWEVIRARFQAVAPLKISDVLESLQSDVSGADESFSDWADSLGMDSDSRKAESIWRQCRETALQIENGLGGAAYREFLAVQA